MAIVRLLVTGDLHYTRQPPRARRQTYAECLREKLAYLRRAAEKVGAVAVCTGDIFHRKHPEEADISDLIRELRGFPGGFVYSVLGNHDTDSPGRMEGTAYECLVEAGVVRDLSETVVRLDGMSLSGAPYMPEGRARELYAGVCADVEVEIRVTHGMLVPEQREYPFAATHPSEIPGRRPRLLLNGHNHDPFEIDDVVNVGSVCRISRLEAEKPRRFLFVRVEDGEVSWKSLPLPCRPVEEAFRDEEDPLEGFEEGVERDEARREIEGVARELAGDVDLLSMEPEELLRRMQVGKVSTPAVEEAFRYLAQARAVVGG